MVLFLQFLVLCFVTPINTQEFQTLQQQQFQHMQNEFFKDSSSNLNIQTDPQLNANDYSYGVTTQRDTSIRCNVSYICEGIDDSCVGGTSADNGLGCVNDNKQRQDMIYEAIKWSWKAYKDYAYGQDDVKPLSYTSRKWLGVGATLIDALDTLWIAGLQEEFDEAIDWIKTQLNLDQPGYISLFELNIRVLGGLLSAFHMSNGDRIVGLKAAELGSRMMPSFSKDPNIMPKSRIDLRELKAQGQGNLAERGTLSLEFGFLARITNIPEFYQPAYNVFTHQLHTHTSIPGLWPNNQNSQFYGVGANADSFYEYLLKHWIQTGKTDDILQFMYKDFIRGVRDTLIHNTDASDPKNGLWYVAEKNSQIIDKMDHLGCFFSGLLALGSYHGINTAKSDELSDLELAEELAYTCYMMYKTMPSGLAPEKVRFLDSGTDVGPRLYNGRYGGGYMEVDGQLTYNILRPETVESLYVLYSITKKEKYRHWGWQIFRAFEMHCKVGTGGYASVQNVMSVPVTQKDEMESFWLAETLKYLYLLFSDEDIFPMDEYVFNTEAHPFPIFGTQFEQELSTKYIKNDQQDVKFDMSKNSLQSLISVYQSMMRDGQ